MENKPEFVRTSAIKLHTDDDKCVRSDTTILSNITLFVTFQVITKYVKCNECYVDMEFEEGCRNQKKLIITIHPSFPFLEIVGRRKIRFIFTVWCSIVEWIINTSKKSYYRKEQNVHTLQLA